MTRRFWLFCNVRSSGGVYISGISGILCLTNLRKTPVFFSFIYHFVLQVGSKYKTVPKVDMYWKNLSQLATLVPFWSNFITLLLETQLNSCHATKFNKTNFPFCAFSDALIHRSISKTVPWKCNKNTTYQLVYSNSVTQCSQLLWILVAKRSIL